MDEIKEEIEIILNRSLSDTNIERLKYNNEEYNQFLDNVLKCILDVKYDQLIALIDKNCIDNIDNIQKYSHELLCLYMSKESPYVDQSQSVVSKTQNFIFWDDGEKLFKYKSKYFIEGVQKYEENKIIIFYRNKKSENLPLASVVDIKGEELFTIDFPTIEDNECVDGNITCYGAGVGYENDILVMDVTLTNGACSRDFWCKYDLDKKEYFDTGIAY
jgi:hypothetical protein